ncbi:hypothetical protein [Kineothrix sp. MB12-C1]|uniref:hypothetical protein n=1 Tax=Kineothrix sp. MB12-C1 TaxID=3070215 RepID=UPI0027D25724|nr:hypothetical protein [Kineothrix sp. MB12-C1]WMC91249.1 hypothetical protein RBB56_10165 [Kineothrix sp. MB12-C1]
MDRLTIEYAGQYVPKKICTVNRSGEADDCASCEEECENDCENCAIQECFNALGVYENLEVTPERIREIDKLYAEKCRELEELKKNHGDKMLFTKDEVENLPIAYDVDKVVKRIDNLFPLQTTAGEFVSKNDVTNLVKGGGVDG